MATDWSYDAWWYGNVFIVFIIIIIIIIIIISVETISKI